MTHKKVRFELRTQYAIVKVINDLNLIKVNFYRYG